MKAKIVGLVLQGWEDILNTLFPRLCLVCMEKVVGKRQKVCITCLAEMPFTRQWDKDDNEFTDRLGIRFRFERGFALFWVKKNESVQKLIQLLKYKGRDDIGVWFGNMLAMRILESDIKYDWDCIVPVPLHPKKERKRGYNQSNAIAKGVSEVLGIPVNNDILRRTRSTVSQTIMNKTQRLSNMKDAFAVKDGKYDSAGKHIFLIDDVLTTGATLEACALALLAVQNLRLSLATIGIAEH